MPRQEIGTMMSSGVIETEKGPDIVRALEKLRCGLSENATLIDSIKYKIINPSMPSLEEAYGDNALPATLVEILQEYVFRIDHANAELEKINSILNEAFGGQIFLK